MGSTACLCLPLPHGVRLIALLSLILGIGAGATSSWTLHRAVQRWKHPTLRTATTFLSEVNTFFGGTTGFYDLEVIFRIIIACSATAMIGGFVQFIMSFWLLLATATDGKTMAKIWVFVQIFVILAIGGGFLCVLTNDLEMNTAITIFLVVTGIDFALLLYCTWVVYAYCQMEDYVESDV